MPKIICRDCGGMFHETTELFDPTKTTDGTMLRLTAPYDAYGWSTFTSDASVTLSDLCCPECEAPYPDDDGVVRSMDGPMPAVPVRIDPLAQAMDALMGEYEPEVPTSANERMDKAMAGYSPELPTGGAGSGSGPLVANRTNPIELLVVSKTENSGEPDTEKKKLDNIFDAIPCPACGKKCNGQAGLAGHSRHCKGKKEAA